MNRLISLQDVDDMLAEIGFPWYRVDIDGSGIAVINVPKMKKWTMHQHARLHEAIRDYGIITCVYKVVERGFIWRIFMNVNWKKVALIVGIIGTIAGIVIPIILKNMPDRQVIKVEDGIIIEQRALIGGGGGDDTVTISKDITVTRNSNQ